MSRLTEKGMSVKIRLIEIGKNQQWLIDQMRIKHPSFESRTLYDIMYVGRKSKYEPELFRILGLDPTNNSMF